MKTLGLFFICFISILPVKAGIKEAWSELSDPSIMFHRFETHFESLPLEGKAAGKNKFWSGDYWPFNVGSINYRWNSPGREGFNLNSPKKHELLGMDLHELEKLSPSEKFDLLNGHYNYPLKNEVEKVAHKEALDWEGICHGWAAASINHNEPKGKVLMNPDGFKIPFGSSDIKALLSYYYAYYHQVDNTFQMGIRCNRAGRHERNNYCQKDLNAGSFHIVLGNKIGKRKQGLLADLDRFREVWNHPVQSYVTKVIKTIKPGSKATKGTVQVIVVKSDLTYISESNNFWEPVIGTQNQITQVKNYLYELDLDADGNIIGGEWLSSERPDFLWLMTKPPFFMEPFSRLTELLND